MRRAVQRRVERIGVRQRNEQIARPGQAGIRQFASFQSHFIADSLAGDRRDRAAPRTGTALPDGATGVPCHRDWAAAIERTSEPAVNGARGTDVAASTHEGSALRGAIGASPISPGAREVRS